MSRIIDLKKETLSKEEKEILQCFREQDNDGKAGMLRVSKYIFKEPEGFEQWFSAITKLRGMAEIFDGAEITMFEPEQFEKAYGKVNATQTLQQIGEELDEAKRMILAYLQEQKEG